MASSLRRLVAVTAVGLSSLLLTTTCHGALVLLPGASSSGGQRQRPLVTHDLGPGPGLQPHDIYLKTPQQQLGDVYADERQLKTEQNESICDAGSRHWTGRVPLGEGRGIFYWYFEALDKPEDAPLVVWTNGGPGGSSMLGAFFEIGPCRISEAGKTTDKNRFTWTKHANMLFIDQPIGVGLSATTSPSLWPTTLLEAGIDVDKFLDVFVGELFPELGESPQRKIHFAGESFGGKYVPVYAAMTRRRFESVILVDPLVDPGANAIATWRHFCPPDSSPERSGGVEGLSRRYLNETACAAMEGAYDACERARRACSDTYAENACRIAGEKCEDMERWYNDEVGPGRRDLYDDRAVCGNVSLGNVTLCHDMGQDRTDIWFNLPHVKQALALPDDFRYESINFRFNEVWGASPEVLLPSTREITALLDVKRTRVLVVNGNNDGAITTEGIQAVFDELPWHGHAAFARADYRPWQAVNSDGSVSSGEVKSHGNLTVVTFDEAGHMSPYDQPEAALGLLGRWLEG